jgi:hypothetical protein
LIIYHFYLSSKRAEINMDTIDNSIHKINGVLKDVGVFDFLEQSSEIYCGGSLPMLALSKKSTLDELLTIINDIDIYTNNISKTMRGINKNLYSEINNIESKGINVNFSIGDGKVPVQLITSSFDDFTTDVLAEYDCDLVSVGYHPYSGEFIITDKFRKGLEDKMFTVIYEKTYLDRIEKLLLRAKYYFECDLKIEKKSIDGSYRPYWKGSKELDTITDIQLSPPYLQIYCNKYKCIKCKEIQQRLLCEKCNDNEIVKYMTTWGRYKMNNVVVFGGINGLGKIIADMWEELEIEKVMRTSRTINGSSDSLYNFDLQGETISNELREAMKKSNCIVFNAYQTLEDDHSIWNTTIDSFNEDLALKRFTINCFGYVRIIQQLIKLRKEMLKNKEQLNDLVIVWMDANESKFNTKLMDGKHLELNMAKTACKQILYTNAQILANLGIITICYDPGWLSYHGISIDKIKSRSEFLISPKTSSLALLNYISNMDIDKMYENKEFIKDVSVYDCL